MTGYVAADPVPHSTPAKSEDKSLTGKASASAERASPSNEQAEKLKFLMRLALGVLGRWTKFRSCITKVQAGT
jgi:hypothetical protein